MSRIREPEASPGHFEEIFRPVIGNNFGGREPVMSQTAGTHRRQSRLSPFLIWRWGFSILLVGVGIWLVIAKPLFAGPQGWIFGWVVIGYAALRLLAGYLSDYQRRPPMSRGRGTAENPLDSPGPMGKT